MTYFGMSVSCPSSLGIAGFGAQRLFDQDIDALVEQLVVLQLSRCISPNAAGAEYIALVANHSCGINEVERRPATDVPPTRDRRCVAVPPRLPCHAFFGNHLLGQIAVVIFIDPQNNEGLSFLALQQ